MLNGLDLFSGIGGISLGLKDYVRPIAYCEIDPYCQAVLFSRMCEGALFKGPIWDDIKTFDGVDFEGSIDIIYGGFPCQDISIAGLGKGLEGERSILVYEIFRLCKEIRPTFLFLENVPAITSRGGLVLVQEITKMGYDCRWCVISAASIGALHKRERWFLLAHSKHNGTFASQDRGSVRECASSGQESQQSQESIGQTERTSGISSDVAYSLRQGCEISGTEEFKEKSTKYIRETDSNSNSQSSEQTNSGTEPEQTERRTRGRHSGQYWPFESREHWQEIVSSMGKCSDGIQFRVDKLRALGNSVVPQQAKEAFEILMGLK